MTCTALDLRAHLYVNTMKFHLTIFPAHKLTQSQLKLGLIGAFEFSEVMHTKF